MKYIVIAFLFIVSIGCVNYEQSPEVKAPENGPLDQSQLKAAYFAQGCFWCVEEIFEALNGVEEVISGYSGGDIENPTYKQVGSGSTKHAEAVKVIYDSTVISYQELLKVYFHAGDVTQVNGQGNDRGTQYRSIIFYANEREKEFIESYLKEYNMTEAPTQELAVQILPFDQFYQAEKYHQNFVKLHPDHGYVKAVSVPRYKKAIQYFPELLK